MGTGRGFGSLQVFILKTNQWIGAIVSVMPEQANSYTALIQTTERVCEQHLGPTKQEIEYREFEQWVLAQRSALPSVPE